MAEYRVKWCQCPTAHHDTKVVFVEADTPEEAKAVVKDHVERRFGIEWFQVGEPELSPPRPQGRVLP